MEIHSDKEYHRKAVALLVCFFIAFMYVETVLKPFTQKNNPAPNTTSSQTTPAEDGTTGASTTPQASSTAAPASTSIAPAPVAVPSATKSEAPTMAQIAEAGSVLVETKSISAKISLLGGRVTELRLDDYKETLAENAIGLNLVSSGEKTSLPLGVYTGELNDAWTKYRLLSTPASSDAQSALFKVGENGSVIELEGVLPDGRTLRKTLSFKEEGYFVDVNVSLSAPDVERSAVRLEWTKLISEDKSSLMDTYNVEGYTWFDGQRAGRQAATGMEEPEITLSSLRWISLADKYFMAALLSQEALVPGEAIKSGHLYRAQLFGGATGASFRLFAGPKGYDLLADAGHELKRNIDFGKFGIVSVPLLELLFFFYGVFGNYGMAIVTLTILVRLALYPLNSASFTQMKKMQDLKPEMDRIREQTEDKQEQQMQMMALYKKHGVNPLGGCLPVLLQMPIFFGLYSALMLAVELRHAHFAFWINDLSAPEKLMIGGIGVPVMVILFVISMMVQQWTTPSQMDPTQKKVMMVMPVVLGFMFANFPSGLTLYWLTSNLISIGQQKGLYWAHDGGKSALKITLSVSAAVFVLALIISFF